MIGYAAWQLRCVRLYMHMRKRWLVTLLKVPQLAAAHTYLIVAITLAVAVAQ